MRSVAPLAVLEVLRPTDRTATLALRWTNRLLVAPIVAAFLELLFFRHVPSILWPALLLAAALAVRLLKSHMVVTERPAALGVDGLALAGRFVDAQEIASAETEGAVVWIATKSGERFELRVDDLDRERVASTVATLTTAMEARPSDAVGGHVLASVTAPARSSAAYRELAFEAERCLSIAEDAATAMPVRIAAATRLSAELTADEATRARIADIAESTASPDLRDELLAALDRAGHTR